MIGNEPAPPLHQSPVFPQGHRAFFHPKYRWIVVTMAAV